MHALSSVEHVVRCSLRFGMLAGREQLLATTQCGNVFLFNVPDPDALTLDCSNFMATKIGSHRVGSQHEAHPVKVRY